MKSGTLVWIDAISLPDLFRPNARDFLLPRDGYSIVVRGEAS